MSGGVVLYAAQTNVKIDAEIVEKGGLQTETSALYILTVCKIAPGFCVSTRRGFRYIARAIQRKTQHSRRVK